MHYLTLTLAIIALIAIALFALQNLAAVEVSFLIWSVSLSKSVVILGAYALGMVSGWGLVELIKRGFEK
jgi:lipopolysaccharide assembly protein A